MTPGTPKRTIRPMLTRGALVVALMLLGASCGAGSDGTEAAPTAAVPGDTTMPPDTAPIDTTMPPDTTATDTAPPTDTAAPTDPQALATALDIAGLPLGATADDVVAMLGKPGSTTPVQEEGASGDFVSTWAWPSTGVEAKMAAPTPDASAVLAAVTLTAPSELRTVAGIGIGDTEDAVRAAYGTEINAEESGEGSIVVGSIFGGLIVSITDAKVVEIFVGAAAE